MPPTLESADTRHIGSPAPKTKLKATFDCIVLWLTVQLTQNRSKSSRVKLSLICLVIFLSAVGVRLLHWQDQHVEIASGESSLSGVYLRYQKEARRILDEGRILFPREQPVDGDARLLAHPPGYSILLAALSRMGADGRSGLWVLQIVCDAAAAVVIFLIGLELLNLWMGIIAAILVGLSPHLAYYSLFLTPDSLAVLPILIAVYLLTKALRRPSVILVVAAGGLIGVSCWLAANAMLLAFFLSGVILLLFKRGKRLILAAALVSSTLLVIAPLTIRNLIVFDRFIPLSIQAGLSLVEGIGDYDKEGRFGMPDSDREARQKDAEWSGRADYGVSLWAPDGIDRDHIRLERGLAVVRSNPIWFLGVMARRAGFMLSYNDSRAREWPLNTASAPPVSREAGYGHAILTGDDDFEIEPEQSEALVLNGALISGTLAVTGKKPAIASSAAELNNSVEVLSPHARVSLEDGGNVIRIAGDNSEYADQFASAVFSVRKNTDYVLVIPISLLNGGMALKVTSADLRTSVAIADLTLATSKSRTDYKAAVDPYDRAEMKTLKMPFASGARTELRIVVSNNNTGAAAPSALLGAAEVFETGPTPFSWTGYVRPMLRSVQRKFTTGRMLMLIVTGIILLLLARQGRALVLLLVVPLYYLTLQSPLHTEYRYILAIHYFLFVIAAVTLGYFAAALVQASRWIVASRRKPDAN
jgi:hypothetical protein